MKKLLTLALLVATTFLSCKKDDDAPSTSSSGSTTLTVERKNRALLIDFSETWCPPCGTSGGPSFDSCLSQEGSLISCVKVYESSTPASLNGPVSTSISNAYGVQGVPDFWVNNTQMFPANPPSNPTGGGVSSSISYNYNWVIQKANAFAADSINAGIALRKEIVGDSIKIYTKVKFFKAQPSGTDYKLATYVVEDGIIASQSTSTGTNPNYVHRNLLRTSNNSSYTGVSINNSASISIDQEFENSYSLYLNPNWNKSKLKVIGVIWKGGSNPHKVINSNVAK
jgi:hypothetical protein